MEKLTKCKADDLRKSNKFVEYSNFVNLAAHLVGYGFHCSWLPVDDSGADFIGVHIKSNQVIKVQVKSRITIDKKYENKNLLIAFPKTEKYPDKEWVIVPHDELIPLFTTPENYAKNGGRSAGSVPKRIWNQIKNISIIEPCDF